MDGHLPTAGINVDQYEQAVQRLLLGGIAHAVTTKQLYLADADIDAIDALRERLVDFVDEQFAYMLRNARTRLRNQRLFAEYDCKVVSLGIDCLSRTLPTRWGLKPPKALGERTHPFDLAVHPYEALCEVIEGDFTTYLDPSQLAMNARNYVVHKQLKIHFNHEIGEKFSANGYEHFIELYNRRVANFRDDVAQHPVLFVLHMTTNQVPTELHGVLARRIPRDDWHLVVINTSAESFNDDAAASAPSGMHLHHIPYPYAGFVWHMAPHFTSPGGRAFERRIIGAVSQAIVENFRRRS